IGYHCRFVEGGNGSFALAADVGVRVEILRGVVDHHVGLGSLKDAHLWPSCGLKLFGNRPTTAQRSEPAQGRTGNELRAGGLQYLVRQLLSLSLQSVLV